MLSCIKSLKIVILVLGNILFTLSGGNPAQDGEPINESKIESPYFLDIDTLRPLRERRRFQELLYTEKADSSVVWTAFPIRSRMRDYSGAVAGVVAAELHRRIDKSEIVPPTKFVITKSKKGSYILLGYVYQEISFAEPIEEARKQAGFNDYATHTIYKDHNIEKSISAWNLLGLSMAPYCSDLAVSKDNRLIRYDYFEAFRYNNTNIDEECFYTSDFSVNSYRCDIGYIKNLKQEQYERYRTTLKTVIDDIRTAASQYLVEDEQQAFNYTLEGILMKFQH